MHSKSKHYKITLVHPFSIEGFSLIPYEALWFGRSQHDKQDEQIIFINSSDKKNKELIFMDDFLEFIIQVSLNNSFLKITHASFSSLIISLHS
jgi:hypothetical protein